MPLIVKDDVLSIKPSSIDDFILRYPEMDYDFYQYKTMTPAIIGANDPYIYVHQAETAVVSPNDPHFRMIGLDNMTTCCALVLRHSGSGVMGAGHFDGSDTSGGISRMVAAMEELNTKWAQDNNIKSEQMDLYHFEVHIIGGFSDERKISHEVALNIIESLVESSVIYVLRTACICQMNTIFRSRSPFPLITGLAIHVRNNLIVPATFCFHGPIPEIRRLRFSAIPPLAMECVYSSSTQLIVIKSFTSNITDDTCDQLLGLNSSSFLHYLSTSPFAEKSNYVEVLKESLQYLKDHRSFFQNGRTYRFSKQLGEWCLIADS